MKRRWPVEASGVSQPTSAHSNQRLQASTPDRAQRVHDCIGVSQPDAPAKKKRCQQHSAQNSQSEEIVEALVEDVLEQLQTHIEDITAEAHQPRPIIPWPSSPQARPQRASFSQQVGTLKRAYVCLLKSTMDGHFSEDLAASVREQADEIKHKLCTHCGQEADAGHSALKEMLEGLLGEYHWDKTIEILQEALTEAEHCKETLYAKARAAEEALRDIRQRGN